MNHKIGKILVFLLVSILLLGIPKISGLIADMFEFSSIDPDGSFMWISVHHIAQAILFVPFFFVVKWFVKDVDFRLGLGDKKLGMLFVSRFSLYFLIYTLVMFGIIIMSNSLQPFIYDVTIRNVVGYLGFQLLLSGPSEELIFRAFAMTVFSMLFTKRLFNDRLSVSNLLAAIIFMLAHVSFRFFPFEYSYSFGQLMYSLTLGLIYGVCYEKTKSVIYPMILHSVSNVISVGVTILATIFFF